MNDDYLHQYAKAVEHDPEAEYSFGHWPFIRAIYARYNDPLPRLVWADYLDEQGLNGEAEILRRHVHQGMQPRQDIDPGDAYSDTLDGGLIQASSWLHSLGLHQVGNTYRLFLVHPLHPHDMESRTGDKEGSRGSHYYFEARAPASEAHRILSAMQQSPFVQNNLAKLEILHPELAPQ